MLTSTVQWRRTDRSIYLSAAQKCEDVKNAFDVLRIASAMSLAIEMGSIFVEVA